MLPFFVRKGVPSQRNSHTSPRVWRRLDIYENLRYPSEGYYLFYYFLLAYI